MDKPVHPRAPWVEGTRGLLVVGCLHRGEQWFSHPREGSSRTSTACFPARYNTDFRNGKALSGAAPWPGAVPEPALEAVTVLVFLQRKPSLIAGVDTPKRKETFKFTIKG